MSRKEYVECPFQRLGEKNKSNQKKLKMVDRPVCLLTGIIQKTKQNKKTLGGEIRRNADQADHFIVPPTLMIFLK